MESEVVAYMTAFSSDFYEHDMKSLNDYDEPFLWVLGKSHTHLIRLGEKYFTDSMENEAVIYAMCQNNTYGDAVTWCIPKDDKVFYYDGGELIQIDADEASHIWKAVKSWALWSWRCKNGMMALPTNFKTPIRFGNGTREKILEILHGENASNLLDEMRHKRGGFKRCASDHVTIYFEDYTSLYFVRGFYDSGEFVRTLNGGILFYNGRWHTHT